MISKEDIKERLSVIDERIKNALSIIMLLKEKASETESIETENSTKGSSTSR